tara:strand:+ start:1309 stop:1815 length:507 start_codon:yes stop_codon:yes gene_type:complete
VKHKIINNFLDKTLFKELKEAIQYGEFPWFYRRHMASSSKEDLDLGYFTHSFYNNHQINSNDYYSKYIIPILKQLKASAIVQIRANMFPSTFYKNKKADFHIDYSLNCKTAIFYLNDCDGGTELKINKKINFIKAEENKVLIFDSQIPHRGTVSEKVDFRYILNFNYY